MKRERNKKQPKGFNLTRIFLLSIVLTVCLVAVGAGLLLINKKESLISDTVKQKREIKKNIERVKDTSYITDVDYTGETYLEPGLFEIPFQKSDVGYVCNKEFVNKVSEETLEKIQNTSKEYVNVLLNSGYQRVKNDQDGFVNNISNMCSSQFRMIKNDRNIMPDELATKARDWYIQNEIQIESEFITDKCLIYENGQIINRGEWHFTVYNGKDLSELERQTGIEKIEIGQKYVVYLELWYIPNIYDEVFAIQVIERNNVETKDEKQS